MRGDRDQRLRLRVRTLRRGQIAVRDHLPEHIVTPRQRTIVVADRIVRRGSLWQDRQIRHLLGRQVGDRLAEICLRRGLDAVGIPPEEDLVEVQLEDLLLGELRLDPPRQYRFLQFARDRHLAVLEQVLCQLLRDRRCADGPLVGAERADVGPHRAHDAGIIEAAMLEEGLVLRRDVGVDQLRRDVVVGQVDATLAGEAGQHAAVVRAYRGGQRGCVLHKRPGVRQALHRPRVQPAGDQQHDDHRARRPERQPCHPRRCPHATRPR